MDLKTFHDELEWQPDPRGGWKLLYKGQKVGSTWVPAPEGPRRRKDEGGAWMAGNKEVGVADTGAQGVSSLEEAKACCWTWVVNRLNGMPALYKDRLPRR
jgi:hypothetical protein